MHNKRLSSWFYLIQQRVVDCNGKLNRPIIHQWLAYFSFLTAKLASSLCGKKYWKEKVDFLIGVTTLWFFNPLVFNPGSANSLGVVKRDNFSHDVPSSLWLRCIALYSFKHCVTMIAVMSFWITPWWFPDDTEMIVVCLISIS